MKQTNQHNQNRQNREDKANKGTNQQVDKKNLIKTKQPETPMLTNKV